jgi:ubiquitin thioesterase OTU1
VAGDVLNWHHVGDGRALNGHRRCALDRRLPRDVHRPGRHAYTLHRRGHARWRNVPRGMKIRTSEFFCLNVPGGRHRREGRGGALLNCRGRVREATTVPPALPSRRVQELAAVLPRRTTHRAHDNAAAMKELQLRLRTRSGVMPLSLPAGAGFPALRTAAAAATGLVASTLVMRAGFPPKPLDMDLDAPVSSLLASGEIVVVHVDPAGAAASSSAAVAAAAAGAAPAGQSAHGSITALGVVVECPVPDDNSCMFRSVAGIVCNDQRADPAPLRRVCADAVAADAAFYSTDMLQMSNAAYCDWILRKASWGGQIELAILSAHYKVELAAWDLRSMVVSRYGEGKYKTVGFLVFDGLHYNFLCLKIPGRRDVTMFPSDDTVAFAEAEAVAKARHDSGSFTDVNSFQLRCKQCGTVVRGERGAQDHGNATGHSQFDECE